MALGSKSTVSEISDLLRERGEHELADRLVYLASDEDLEPSESPATDESARGFFEFFTSVKSDSKIGLACSPEGWVVGEWQWYPDKRSLTVWFYDAERVGFVATNKNGEFVSRDWNGKTAGHSEVKSVLGAEGLFVCHPSS